MDEIQIKRKMGGKTLVKTCSEGQRRMLDEYGRDGQDVGLLKRIQNGWNGCRMDGKDVE